MEQYYFVTDGTVIYRFGVRDGSYVTDKTLTDDGFDGDENTDWENLDSLTLV